MATRRIRKDTGSARAFSQSVTVTANPDTGLTNAYDQPPVTTGEDFRRTASYAHLRNIATSMTAFMAAIRF